MKENDIFSIRQKIDSIDQELINLIGQRAKLAQMIGRLKQANGLSLFDSGREKDMIKLLVENNVGPLNDTSIIHIFREIISACRAVQGMITVSYLGPEGTFTHLAALEYFGHSCTFLPQDTIVDVFHSLETGRVDYGVVPIENSNEGTVGLTLDRLSTTNAKICGETLRRISHTLMSQQSELGKVQSVYSHPQALAQCFKWLNLHLPGKGTIQMSSTAAAAKRASEDSFSAAVGSEILADRYGLKILAEDIQDEPVNLTRFIILGKTVGNRSDHDKTTIVFSAPHRPGALYEILASFADKSINISKIESRPARDRPWEYIFFLDLEGHPDDEKMAVALDEVEKIARNLKILGSYPFGELQPQRARLSKDSITASTDKRV